MSEERYKLIKENVYTRCHIAEYTGIGLSCPDKEEIELIDYVEELKDQLQQKENIIKEVRDNLENSIKSINEKLKNNKEPFEVINGIIQYINDYRVVRLKAFRTKCKELLEILDKEK